jgi:hypothetical protein
MRSSLSRTVDLRLPSNREIGAWVARVRARTGGYGPANSDHFRKDSERARAIRCNV